jgi:hypothetical protein
MFVILRPNSGTNTSNRFRLVNSDDWCAFVNGAKRAYAFTEFNTHDEAVAAQEKANQK